MCTSNSLPFLSFPAGYRRVYGCASYGGLSGPRRTTRAASRSKLPAVSLSQMPHDLSLGCRHRADVQVVVLLVAVSLGASMARNTYYRSAHWRALKRACHIRDGRMCTVPGCAGTDGLVADHIQTRPNSDGPTWADQLGNLRTLCGHHDRQVKEAASGKRGNGGTFRPMIQYDENGWPK
jgi:hypothetical protein